MTPDDPPRATDAQPPRPAGLLQIAGAVFWSFFGIRKRSAMNRDAVTIKPLHVIVVGLVLAAVFVATLISIVRIVISSSG